MAVAYKFLSQFETAIKYYQEAVNRARLYKDEEAVARHQKNLAICLFVVGDYEAATRAALESIGCFEQLGKKNDAIDVLVVLCRHLGYDGASSDLIAKMRASMEVALSFSHPVADVYAQELQAHELMRQGDVDDALSLSSDIIDKWRHAEVPFDLAMSLLSRAHLLRGVDPMAAEADVREAEELASDAGYQHLTARCCEFRLRLALNQKDVTRVEGILERLLPLWIHWRLQLKGDGDRVTFADRIAAALDPVIALFAEIGDKGRVFELLEWTRAQALSDLIYLAGVESLSEASTDEEPQAEGEAAHIASVCSLASNIGSHWSPLSLSGVRALLGKVGRAAVVICLDYIDERIVCTALRNRQDQPHVYHSGVTRADVLELRETFELEMYEFAGYSSLDWYNQAACLFGFVDKLIQDGDLVIFVVDEDLQTLPLHAICLGDGKTITERAAVVYAPSLTVLEQTSMSYNRTERSGPDIVSVGVTFEEEAEVYCGGIRRTITGEALDKHYVLDAIRNAPVAHFSCHGQFVPEHYQESGLILSSADEPLRKHVLSVRDIMAERLNNDLVTLMACDTGRGEIAVSEFLGLARAFLAGGAHAVIATLWPVESSSTAELTNDFYGELVNCFGEQHEAADLAEALRISQLKHMSRMRLYDWAGLKLVGWPILRGGG